MDNWSRVIAAVVESLPGDIQRRVAVLEALSAVIPPDHDLSPKILAMCRDLYSHINSQRDLFASPSSSPATRGSARLTDRRVRR